MDKNRQIVNPVRGEIYLVSSDPTLGAEIQKNRPALILQNDVSNQHSPITIVAAIASKFDKKLYPTEILISTKEGGLNIDSVALLNQIRSIDRQRLIKRLGRIKPETIKKVDMALKISLGLAEI